MLTPECRTRSMIWSTLGWSLDPSRTESTATRVAVTRRPAPRSRSVSGSIVTCRRTLHQTASGSGTSPEARSACGPVDDPVQPLHQLAGHVRRPLPDVAADHDAARAVLDGLTGEGDDPFWVPAARPAEDDERDPQLGGPGG